MLQDFWAGALGTRSKEALDLLPDIRESNGTEIVFGSS